MSKNDIEGNEIFNSFREAGSNYIREYSYKHGNEIYNFMNKYDIGKSSYGQLMDEAAKGKHIITHRLYGHHPIYNIPFDCPKEVVDFYEHIFSDLFTKQGIPIIPGEIIENTRFLKFCDKLTGSWNFVNGFDILAGTLAIYDSTNKLFAACREELFMDSFEDFAKTFGLGALELAISISTANPFLLLGAIVHITSGVRASFNDSAFVFMKNRIGVMSLEIVIGRISYEEKLKKVDPIKIIQSIDHNNYIKNTSYENILENMKKGD